MSAEQVAKWEHIFDIDLAAISRLVERDARLQRSDTVLPVNPSCQTSATSKPKSRTRRLDERTRAKHRQTNRKAEAADREPPKPVVPRSLLDEAEELVREFEAKRQGGRAKPNRHQG